MNKDNFEIRNKIYDLVKSGTTFLVKDPSIELIKPEEHNKMSWVWLAQLTIRNNVNNHETRGIGTANFIFEDKIDRIAHLKAQQKAEVSAYENHMKKEVDINEEEMKKKEITEKQIETLKKFGYEGDKPANRWDAYKLIQSYFADKKKTI